MVFNACYSWVDNKTYDAIMDNKSLDWEDIIGKNLGKIRKLIRTKDGRTATVMFSKEEFSNLRSYLFCAIDAHNKVCRSEEMSEE